MDKNKLIENIKAQLKSLMTSEVKFAEIKAGDLMITSQDEVLVVGSEVFTIDQDGNNIPLSDGDYTLDSGEVITVVSGKIEGIVTTTPEEVEAVEEEVDETETPEQAEEPAVGPEVEEDVEIEATFKAKPVTLTGVELKAVIESKLAGAPISSKTIHKLMVRGGMTNLSYDDEIAAMIEENNGIENAESNIEETAVETTQIDSESNLNGENDPKSANLPVKMGSEPVLTQDSAA